METQELLQPLVLFTVLFALAPLVGQYLWRVYTGQPVFLTRLVAPLERGLCRLCRIAPEDGMPWTVYLKAVLSFSFVSFVALFVLQLNQSWLPLNPDGFSDVPWPLAFNTAISFVTNTNWQAYAGEATMSWLVQMFGLGVQNFVSAATGISVLVALARGIAGRTGQALGNFWVDLVRSVLYVLLPLAILVAVLLVGQGVVQTLSPGPVVTEAGGVRQSIPLGPVASQVAIKMLGTNGGGFFGQNGAHPFENPTPFSNFIELLAMLLLPFALVFMYGRFVADRRHARVLVAVMLFLLAASFVLTWRAEAQSAAVAGASMEGKEVRFGVMNSALFAAATTGTSCGAVNAMHDSFQPLAGMLPLLNMMLGCIAPGGDGAGLYGMLLYVLLTVFLAGLLVGRTPEYLGKKLGAREASWSAVGVLVPGFLILIGAAIASLAPGGQSGPSASGPHGFSQLLYAFSSAAANNGSAFAGLAADSPFYNIALGIVMLLGRFVTITAVLAVAGGFTRKNVAQKSAGTFPTDGLTFALLLLAVILIVGALTFFPALTLGPIVEQLLLAEGRVF